MNVRNLNLKFCGINIVSTTKDKKYGHAQREASQWLYVLTHSSTKYKKTVDLIESTSVMEDLFRFHSLHFEALHGDKEGYYSVRVNDQYRLEFKLEIISKEPIITLCTLTELSNHYKK